MNLSIHSIRLLDYYNIKQTFTSNEEVEREVNRIVENRVNEKIKNYLQLTK